MSNPSRKLLIVPMKTIIVNKLKKYKKNLKTIKKYINKEINQKIQNNKMNLIGENMMKMKMIQIW